MIIEKYDWKFNVDIHKTQSMNVNRVKSEIDAQRQLPEFEKPDEYNSDLSDVVYTFIGSAESETNYEIDMYGKERFIFIVIYNKNGSVM